MKSGAEERSGAKRRTHTHARTRLAVLDRNRATHEAGGRDRTDGEGVR